MDIEAQGGTPTDAIDAVWAHGSTNFEGSKHLLDGLFDPSTVENIAAGILGWFNDLPSVPVMKVTVWEDDARYGVAILPSGGGPARPVATAAATPVPDPEPEPERAPALAMADRPFIH